MSARDEILANVRRSLGVSATDAARRANVEGRVQRAAPGVRPLRGQGDEGARVAIFIEQALLVSASVAQVPGLDAVPAEIARYLRAQNLPATLRMGADERLANLPWGETQLSLSTGPSAGDDLNSVSFAEAGVAETGTLALVSGPHNPTTLNFLPDNHIVVLRAGDVEPDYEAVWSRLRARFGKGLMPRTVNLVTGPSRSADIEQKLLLGAHGPRRLHIVLVRG
ncbi:MAG: lactate utilization protein [Hyphomicrobiales bacterium]|nr:lactate utilization protein [Hyphomicrobiales bacterium]